MLSIDPFSKEYLEIKEAIDNSHKFSCAIEIGFEDRKLL